MRNFKAKPTILIVDDDQTLLSIGTLMIQRSGYKVLQATSGKEAIQIFQNYKDDVCLVMLEEKLPDESGSVTCKRLKEFEPDVKILHTSGLGKSLGDDSFDCGCEAFLSKPFRINELSNKLREVLQTSKG
jgi:DNA-binding response OmpR family regulator